MTKANIVLEHQEIQIEDSIERSRRLISQSLQDLQHEVQDRFNAAAWVQEHPLEAVGAAFALGFLLGARPYL